jgi:RND superfamily putative drug exporter
MFHRLGAFVSRFWPLVIAAWLALLAALRLVAPHWDDVTKDGDLAYLPPDCTSVRAEKLLEEAFPEANYKSQLVVIVERADGPLAAEDDAVIRRLFDHLRVDLSDYIEPPRPVDLEPPVETSPAESESDGGPSPSERLDPSSAAEFAAGAQGEPSASKLRPVADLWSPVAVVDEDDSTYQARVAHGRAELLRSAVSENGQAALIVQFLRTEFMATSNMRLFDDLLASLADFEESDGFPRDRLRVGVCGSAAVGADMMNSAAESIRSTELATIALVLVILLVVYRAPMLALIPLATIGASVFIACDSLALLAQFAAGSDWFDYMIFKTTKIFIVVILFGAGTDFCLFLIARYREELDRGLPEREALTLALGRVGEALAASALTTILGLLMMAYADFGKFRFSGPSLAICLTVALLASLTLAPALLRAAGGVVFWPRGTKSIAVKRDETSIANVAPEPAASRFWQRVADGVIARPGLILIAVVVLLSPLAWHGATGVKMSYDLLSELREDRPSVQGTRMLARHFPPGYTSPVTVVAQLPGDRGPEDDFSDLSRMMDVHQLSRYIRERVPGVRQVRGWATPLGESEPSLDAQARAEAKPHYVSEFGEWTDRLTRFSVVFDSDPFAPESRRQLEELKTALAELASSRRAAASAAESDPADESWKTLWTGAEFDYGGTTAATADLERVTTADQRLIRVLCVLVVFAVLLGLLRRPVVCVYLILSVLFSYLVAIGTTQAVFSVIYGEAFGGLDWKVPLFLFVILVAVGEDYNIYLATRVLEEQRRRGPIEGLREAVVRTGGIITSCGLIMAGTFVAMMSGSLRGMLELGFALSLGILLDTFVVRTILVPAFLALWHRRGDRSAETDAGVAEGDPLRPASRAARRGSRIRT